MSKYNNYAKRLAEAFHEATEALLKEGKDVTYARGKEGRAKAWTPGEDAYEKQLAIEVATANRKEAERKYKTLYNQKFEEFNEKCKQLQEELAEEIQRDVTMNPDAIDPNGLAIINSGIMTAGDVRAMAAKYEGNATMMRLLADGAQKRMQSDTMGVKERAQMLAAADEISTAADKTLENFNKLCELARFCSTYGRTEAPESDIDYTSAMWAEFDNTAGNTIENF